MKFALLGIIAAALVLAGCGNLNRVPRYDVPEPMTMETFKRQTKYPAQGLMNFWRKDSFQQVNRPISGRLSESQKDLLERHGQPDYIREGWRSKTNEVVDEWAWWDRSIVAQFVQRELVYEGELSDMDRTRIRYGNPRRAWTQEYEEGVRRDIWDYQGIIYDTRGLLFTFSDEKLVTEQRY